MLILSDEARYKWTHGINVRNTDLIDNKIIKRKNRTSLTFRKILNNKNCKCSYTNYCDTPTTCRV